MDFIDYRKALGLDFFDEDKRKYFTTRIFNMLDGLENCGLFIGFDEYWKFCSETASRMNQNYSESYMGQERFRHCVKILSEHRKNFKELLLYYVWFANCINKDTQCSWKRDEFISFLENTLTQSHIAYEILKDEDRYFLFPKGAKELDDALVSEPLRWLEKYPGARKTYIIALKQYSEGIYVRDVADNLRKALETFLQEVLGNSKNLETNKTEICKYLGEKGVDAGISGLFHPLLNAYKNINDRMVKHNDAIDRTLLEFILYQTGVLIRMVIVVKNSVVDTEK